MTKTEPPTPLEDQHHANGADDAAATARHANTTTTGADSSSSSSSDEDSEDSDDTMYFSDCDVQFLPEPANPNDYTNAAYEVMYDVMTKQMVGNWRTVRTIFQEQFDSAHLCKEEYIGPSPRQFKTFVAAADRRKSSTAAAQQNLNFSTPTKLAAAAVKQESISPTIVKSITRNGSAGRQSSPSKNRSPSNNNSTTIRTTSSASDDFHDIQTTTTTKNSMQQYHQNVAAAQSSSSVWPADCCTECRRHSNLLQCSCPVVNAMPREMLDGEQPNSALVDMQPVVRTLKLAHQLADVRLVLPHASHQHSRIARMEFGRALKYPTYETRYVKPLPAGNFWLPLANNMHARDQITYRVVPYISEDIDIGKWELEYSEMHEQRRDRAAYRRVRDRLFSSTPALTEVVKRMKRQLKKTSKATASAAEADGTFEVSENKRKFACMHAIFLCARVQEKFFKALSDSVPNAPSPDELYEQKFRFPNDPDYRNLICLPSLDADPSYDCSYEKRIHTFQTLYCPKCRFFDCHEHEHKQCAPEPQLKLVPLAPPPASVDGWCSKECFASISNNINTKSSAAAATNDIEKLSAVVKVYLNDMLHEPTEIPGYYANSTGSSSASALLLQTGGGSELPAAATATGIIGNGLHSAASSSNLNANHHATPTTGGRNTGAALGEARLCCDVTKMVNNLLADPKLHVSCATTYKFYLSLLAARNGGGETINGGVELMPAAATATAATSSGARGRRRGGGSAAGNNTTIPSTNSSAVDRIRHKRSTTASFKQAPAYKAMQSSRQLSKLPHEPCHHPEFSSCLEAGDACSCTKRKIFCEKFCGCDDRYCYNRVRQCTCTSGCNSLRCPCFVAERECDPARCRCEQIGMCKNMAMQLGLKKKIVVAQSSTHGFGVFIMEDAREGEFIYEYMGEKVSDYEAERRGRFYDKLGLSFLFGLNAEESIDATRCGNKIRFANHSERHPNLAARIMSVFGDHRIGLYALRDIRRGEELFFNYFYKGNHLKFVPNEVRFTTTAGTGPGAALGAQQLALLMPGTSGSTRNYAAVVARQRHAAAAAAAAGVHNDDDDAADDADQKPPAAATAGGSDIVVQPSSTGNNKKRAYNSVKRNLSKKVVKKSLLAKKKNGDADDDDDVAAQQRAAVKRIKRSSSSMSREQQQQKRNSTSEVLDELLGEVIDEDEVAVQQVLDLSGRTTAP